MRLENWNPSLASDEITQDCMNRLEKGAHIVAGRAKQKAPVGKNRPQYKNGKPWTARKAGAMRDSIRVVRLKDKSVLNVRVYVGNKETYYPPFVEYGTSKMPAKPFLRPALNESGNDIMNLFEGGNG